MENNNLHKLGIDIGSTTVKIAVLDKEDQLLFSDYERHSRRNTGRERHRRAAGGVSRL